MPSRSALSRVPFAKRKQLAATLGLFAVLFLAVGAVAATGPGTIAIRAFVIIALVVAVLLALAGWGVAHSIREETNAADAERDLDAVIDKALASASRTYGSLCNCGHEHDPTELHITDAEPNACAHDGAGDTCGHNCETCVLAALRPSPTATRAERLG